MTNIFSLGSTQKYVPPAPPQKYSPREPGTGASPGSTRTANPKPTCSQDRADRRARGEPPRPCGPKSCRQLFSGPDSVCHEHAAVNQHLQEAGVVGRDADHSLAAELVFVRNARIVEFAENDSAGQSRQLLSCAAAAFALGLATEMAQGRATASHPGGISIRPRKLGQAAGRRQALCTRTQTNRSWRCEDFRTRSQDALTGNPLLRCSA